MGYEIYSSPNSIQETAKKHRELINKLTELKDMMQNEKLRLMGEWEGIASENYGNELTRYTEFYSANLQMLNGAVEFEEKSAQRYIQAENRVRAIIESL